MFKRSIVKENELNNNVRNGKYNAVKTIHSKEKDSSVGKSKTFLITVSFFITISVLLLCIILCWVVMLLIYY